MTAKTTLLGSWHPPLLGAIWFRELAKEQTDPVQRRKIRKFMRERALAWKRLVLMTGLLQK